MQRSSFPSGIIFLFLLVHLASCNNDSKVENSIKDAMKEQENCWNSGNIECFMKHYWHSDSLMFIGKSGVTYGWQKVLDNYKKNYSSPQKMGQLIFDIIKVKRIDNRNYFVVGSWLLSRPEEGDLSGHFTLLWKKVDGQWVIVSDHSS